MRLSRYFAAALLAAAALLPARAGAEAVIEFHQVDTSVAFGTAFGDIFPDMDGVRAGTELSSELATTIEDFYGEPRLKPALGDMYASLDNLAFLLGPLTQYGNAGQQLYDAFNAHFATLDALIGGVGTYFVAPPVHVGTENYSLYGGTIDAIGNPVIDPSYCDTNACRVIVGNVTVEFYETTGEFDAHGADLPVPEPATLALFAVGLAGLGLGRRCKGRKRP